MKPAILTRMIDRELMQQALEALESAKYGMAECRQEIGFDFANEQYDVEQAITALRERLAQPEQEPVDEINAMRQMLLCVRNNLQKGMSKSIQRLQAREINEVLGLPAFKSYLSDTTPPRREWVGLTEEEWAALWEEFARESEFTLDEQFQEEMVKKHGKGHYYMDTDEAWNRQKDLIQKLVTDKLREKNA